MRKRRVLLTTILALLLVVTALPLTGLTAQAAETYTGINDANRAKEDGTYLADYVVSDPDDELYFYIVGQNGAQVAYCLNADLKSPKTTGSDHYEKGMITASNINNYIPGAPDGTRNALIGILYNGYPKNGSGL